MKNCDDKLLIISYRNEIVSEFVKYENTNLLLYEKSNYEENSDRLNIYNIKYDKTNGIKIDYNNSEIDIATYQDTILMSKKITEILEQIHYLKNIQPVKLDIEDKVLIAIYKLFYNENPDFSSKDINIKIQVMMSLLGEFGISLGENYRFRRWEKSKMPISFKLEEKVNKSYPLGEIKDIENNTNLTKEYKKIIKIVGEIIRKTISNKQNKNEALITISKVIYEGIHCFSSNIDIKKLSIFTGCTNTEIESSIRLVKRIENRIDKQLK